MGNYEELKTAIQQVIRTNENNEITGAILQNTLLSIINSLGVGYQYVGIATPETNPGTPDQKIFYIAPSGNYPNFGYVVADGYFGVFKYDNQWRFETVIYMANGSITNEKIANGAITNEKIADNSIGWSKLQNQIIQTPNIANKAVTKEKIANDSITSEKIADNSIGSSELSDQSVNNSKIANRTITKDKLNQSLIDYIDSAGGGSIENYPDNKTIVENEDNELSLAQSYKVRGAQGEGGNTDGNARGVGATDFQLFRDATDKVAQGDYSFIAGGRNNAIKILPKMATSPTEAHVEGKDNVVVNWQGHAEGQHCICDGKISHVEGNTCIASSNDAHAEGNRTNTGRRYWWRGITYGSEDAGDGLGVLPYIIIPATNGNVSAFFPNALIDSEYITTHYGSGASKDEKGNIYPSGMVPAIWAGDTPTTPNDLQWALHSICIVRGPREQNICYAEIKKVTFDTTNGTKVYFVPEEFYPSYMGIYSSYAPTVLIEGENLGNGGHAEGVFGNSSGYGSHVEGYYCEAYGNFGSHAEGANTVAAGQASHAEGWGTHAKGHFSHAEGENCISSGRRSHAEGMGCVASNEHSHAEGTNTTSSGNSAHAEGINSVASGDYSHASGNAGVAKRVNQHSIGGGYINVPGDSQHARFIHTLKLNGAGWFDYPFFYRSPTDSSYDFGLEPDRTYVGNMRLVGRNIDVKSVAYNFKFLFVTGIQANVVSVDVANKIITLDKSLPVGTRLIFKQTGGDSVVTPYYYVFVIESIGNSIKVAASQGGSVMNVQEGTGYFIVLQTANVTRELLGYTFDVGDGLTDGVRANFLDNYWIGLNPYLRIDALSTTIIHWVSDVEWTEVQG